MIPLIETNWNRPLLALAMICITIVTCYTIYYLTHRKW